MNFLHILYLLLLTTSFIISIIKVRESSMRIFPYLLGFSLFTEIFVTFMYANWQNNELENITYQIYAPLEFTLLVIFFSQNTTKPIIRKIILWLIPVFYLLDLILGFRFDFTHFPSQVVNMEGIIISILASNLLLNLPLILDKPLYKIPVLWISFGLLLYYSSSFIFYGLYNYLITRELSSFEKLRQLMMKVPNYLLYVFLSIGFLCHKPTKN